jgi:hypothetical protein
MSITPETGKPEAKELIKVWIRIGHGLRFEKRSIMALMLMVLVSQSVRWFSNASFQAQKSIRNPKLLHRPILLLSRSSASITTIVTYYYFI